MSKLKLFLLFLFIFSSGQAHAVNVSEQNGNDWLKWSELIRVYYVIGFLNGSGYVVENNNVKIPRSNEVEVAHKEVMMSTVAAIEAKTKVCLNHVDLWNYTIYEKGQSADNKSDAINKYSILNITTQTIVDGLGSFYSDFKNRNIKIGDAIYVVKKQVNGESPDNLERIILFLRNGKSIDAWNKHMMQGPLPFGGYISFP